MNQNKIDHPVIEMEYIAFIVFVYLIAAIPFGFCISACLGIDIRNKGSGNIGATNVTRVMGMGFGFVVFVLDFLKAVIPVVIAFKYSGCVFASVVGFVAVFAQVFPVYLGFKGGKGVATMMGFYFVLSPLIFSAIVSIWGVLFLLFRYSFLSSLTACFVGAVWSYFVFETPIFLCIFAGTIIVFIRHIGNIKSFLRARG